MIDKSFYMGEVLRLRREKDDLLIDVKSLERAIVILQSDNLTLSSSLSKLCTKYADCRKGSGLLVVEVANLRLKIQHGSA